MENTYDDDYQNIPFPIDIDEMMNEINQNPNPDDRFDINNIPDFDPNTLPTIINDIPNTMDNIDTLINDVMNNPINAEYINRINTIVTDPNCNSILTYFGVKDSDIELLKLNYIMYEECRIDIEKFYNLNNSIVHSTINIRELISDPHVIVLKGIITIIFYIDPHDIIKRELNTNIDNFYDTCGKNINKRYIRETINNSDYIITAVNNIENKYESILCATKNHDGRSTNDCYTFIDLICSSNIYNDDIKTSIFTHFININEGNLNDYLKRFKINYGEIFQYIIIKYIDLNCTSIRYKIELEPLKEVEQYYINNGYIRDIRNPKYFYLYYKDHFIRKIEDKISNLEYTIYNYCYYMNFVYLYRHIQNFTEYFFLKIYP